MKAKGKEAAFCLDSGSLDALEVNFSAPVEAPRVFSFAGRKRTASTVRTGHLYVDDRCSAEQASMWFLRLRCHAAENKADFFRQGQHFLEELWNDEHKK